MIRDIKEVNFPSYATLREATITMNAMGDKTITAQVYIDGDVVPEFVGTDGEPWTVEFNGEKYVLPTREPQASKSNEQYSSVIDLTFREWAVYQLQRYYFAEMSSVDSGTAIADKYEASLGLTLPNFAIALGKVLKYYYGDKIIVDCNEYPTTPYDSRPSFVQISYSYIWDVLQNLNDIYDVRWYIQYRKLTDTYVIRIGYSATEVTHTFEYGFKGGLLKFERQVQSDEIKNIILGRGGETNLPKLYFKDYSKFPPASGVTDNGEFEPDPDAIPELVNIYFDALRDSNFRKYVQGWKAQKHYDGAQYQFGQGWAYEKGYTDTKFDPVEYVKDDKSIATYGERWGALDNNDDIYPSIQGVTVDPYGRIDEVIDVSKVVTDDLDKLSEEAVVITNVQGASISASIPAQSSLTKELRGSAFTVPSGNVGTLTYQPFVECSNAAVIVDTAKTYVKVYNSETDEEVNASSIPAGTFYYVATVSVTNSVKTALAASFGIQQVKCSCSNPDKEEWKPTFDIWVKNIWNTTKKSGETDAAYADRVWRPILGDREGNEAAVVFSDGFLAVSDYEFTIVGYAYDTSKTLDGVASHWKLTLSKTDAEYEATGLYVPNATTGGNASPGDHFYFIGCDLPYQYVYWAEQKLTAYKEVEGLSKNSQIQPTWVVTLDKVRINTPDEEMYGIKLVDLLEVGAIANIRDKRFTGNDILQLYIKTLTYKWGESSIVPDVEIVLSDKLIAVKSSSDEIRGEISAIKSEYVTAETVAKTVEAVTSKLYLRKSGVSDVSYSPTAFAAPVTDTDFEAGEVGGTGWGFYEDEKKMSVLETDKLIVRKEMHVNELVINQVSYVGGKQIISAACIECTQVDDTDDGYVCHFNQKRGSVGNLFKVGDVAMSQVFSTSNVETKYYKRRVEAIDLDSITLSKTEYQGSGIPAVGDVIVQYGSYTDVSRRYVILRDIIGGGNERMLYGLSSVTTDGIEYYFAGRENGETPRVFIGDKDLDFIEYKDGKLKIKADVELEAGSDLYEQVNTNSEQIKAQHKIFYDVPTAPYKSGDLWVNAGYPSGTYADEQGNGITLENGDVPYESLLYDDDVLVCISDNDSTFDLSDWRFSSRYHNDAANIQAVSENFNNYKTATDLTLEEFRDQIDGVVDNWFFNYVPTNDNFPANTWTTTAQKQQHVGDTFTNNETYIDDETTPNAGLSWRWVGVGDYDEVNKCYASYQWNEIANVDAIKALKAAAAAQDTADGKRRVFTTLPTVPYDEGDLWVNATYGKMYSNDLLRVKDGKSKPATGTFDIGDWELASGYTNDAAFNAFLTNEYNEFVSDIQTQVDGKAETFYQATDPSSSWSSADKADHVGDLWYNTTADANGYYHTFVYKITKGVYGWAEINGVPTAVFDSFDGRATIFTSKPKTYRTNDIWIIGKDVTSAEIPAGCAVGDVVVSMNDRTNSYVIKDWVKKDRYTDNSVFEDFFANDYTEFKSDIQNQVDGKAETFYQATDPSLAWDNETKGLHVGDLWFNTNADANGNTHTYIYKVSGSGYSWEENNGVPQSVFDTIDGKASIFVSKPTTYDVNDMWIIEEGLASSDMPSGCEAGGIVISSTSRTGSYTKSDWSKKDRYTDDGKIDGILDGINSDSTLSEFEKLSLRTKLKEINPSETSSVVINDGEITKGVEILSSGSFGAWTLVESGEFKGYYQSSNHTDGSYSINRFTIKNSNSLSLRVKVVVSGETFYDYAAIGDLDKSLTYSNSAFVGASKTIKGEDSSIHLVTDEAVFAFSAGTHTIDIGYRKDTSTSIAPDCVYVLLEFDGCGGSLNDWVQSCIKAGISYAAAVSAANNLFSFMNDICHVWENTDTVFESSTYLKNIDSLIAAYNAAVSGVVQSVPDLQYLKTALGSDIGTTTVSGGITLGTFIGVKDTDENVVAGLNSTVAIGNDATNGRLMIFAGAGSASKANEAKFRVYENGYVFAQNAEIRGAIYAESGEFRGNIVIGTPGSRRVEVTSGDYGTISMFDSADNVTTHFGNDYCGSVSSYLSNVSVNSPIILSSNGLSSGTKGWTFSKTINKNDTIEVNSGQYTGRMFEIQGNPQSNKLVGSISCSCYSYGENSASSHDSPAFQYVTIQLFACTDTKGNNPTSLGYLTNNTAEGFTSNFNISAMLAAGTYYVFAKVSINAYWDSIYDVLTANLTFGYAACSVTALEQKMSIFANGFGYKAASTQYFAVINENASASSPTGDLAIKMRTNSTSAASKDIGIDCTTSGLRLYGIGRTQLGYGASTGTFSMTDCSSYSFIEIRAVFRGTERVIMFMTCEEWQASTSTYALHISTDSAYVKLHRYNDTQFKIIGSSNFTSLTIWGI